MWLHITKILEFSRWGRLYYINHAIIYSSNHPDKDIKVILSTILINEDERTIEQNNTLNLLFISEKAIDCIRRYDENSFLKQREEDIMNAESSFVQQLGMSYTRDKK